MAEDDRLLVFEVSEGTAQFRRHAEGLEEVGGDNFTLYMLRFGSANEIEALFFAGGKELQDGSGCLPPVGEIGIRGVAVESAGLEIVGVDLYEEFGIWKRQGPKQDGVEDAEHAGVQSNAERQRGNRGDCEAGRLSESA